MNSEKYALCLHGKIGVFNGKTYEKNEETLNDKKRILDLSFKHWYDYLLKDNNIDIFIHSWNKECESLILEKFNPKSYLIEEQEIFDIPNYVKGSEERKQAHYSRWKSTEKSFNLLKRYLLKSNTKYKGVMIARFDIAWQKKFEISSLDTTKFYCGGWLKNRGKVKDFWFYSDVKKMYRFSKLFKMLDEYNNDVHSTFTTNKNLGISNHRLSKYHLDMLKYDIAFYMQAETEASKNSKNLDFPLIRDVYENK